MWFPFFETGLEQPTGRFWQTDRRERTNMHHRVDAVTTASYPFAHQQTTHASKPHLNGLSRRSGAIGSRGGLSLLLYSPAQDGKHIKCFPLRAELATNLTRPGPRWPQTCQKGTGLFWSVLSGDMPRARLSTIQIIRKLNRLSDKIATRTNQPFCYSRRGPRVKFIASSARAGEHLMCSPCEQDCRAGNFTRGPRRE